jgi:hypothetical protein
MLTLWQLVVFVYGGCYDECMVADPSLKEFLSEVIRHHSSHVMRAVEHNSATGMLAAVGLGMRPGKDDDIADKAAYAKKAKDVGFSDPR